MFQSSISGWGKCVENDENVSFPCLPKDGEPGDSHTTDLCLFKIENGDPGDERIFGITTYSS